MSSQDIRTLPTDHYIVLDLESHGLSARFDPDCEIYFGVTLTVDAADRKPTLEVWHCIDNLVFYLHAQVKEGYSLVVHNAKFDVAALLVRGLTVPFSAIYCTQTLAYLHDNTRESYSLSALTGMKEDLMSNLVEEGLLEAPMKVADFWNTYWGDNEPMIERLQSYCKKDTRACYALYKTLAGAMAEEVVGFYLRVQQPMLQVLIDLENTGIALDTALLTSMLSDYTAQEQALIEQIKTSVGRLPKLSYDKETESYEPVAKEYTKGSYTNKLHVPPFYTDNEGKLVRSWEGHLDDGSPLVVYNHCPLIDFNPAPATGHTYWVIARDSKAALEFAGKTKSGKPQINKDFIKNVDELLSEDFPIGKLAKVTKSLQMVTTLAENVSKAGRVHCEFAHTRTLTGRLATQKPNLQNIPRAGESEESQQFRKLFVASPGCTLLVADFAAIELRMLAYFLAKVEADTSLAEVFAGDDADAHTANALKWGVSRTVAKTLIFLLIYGGQPKLMFARKLFSTIEEAEAAFAGVHESQPSIKTLMGKVIKRATAKGYVRSLGGRHMHYPGLNSPGKFERLRAERQCFNALIQGSSADVLHTIIVESAPAVWNSGAHFVNVVHDEVIVEVPTETAPALLASLNGIWNDRLDLAPGVPITGDWNSGATWYEAK